MKYLPLIAVLLLLVTMLGSCSSSIYRDVYPTLIDGRYDSEFPYRGCSEQLEEISETVRRITVIAHYKSYSFPRSDSVRLSDISKRFLDSLEPVAAYQHYSVAGTGTVIYNENNRIALLTCAHIVDFNDTLVSRYVGANDRLSQHLRSIAFKTSQVVFLIDVAGGIMLETLAIDRIADLAIIGKKVEGEKSLTVKVFRYPLGISKQLEWGSFVYLFGYPSGYRMITKGIVSLSSKPPRDSFIIDAVVSPGSSGSIAMAIRDGVPNFELVGVVKMIPAQTSYILTPPPEGAVEYDLLEPYHGEVFVKKKAEVQQGIAVAIPTETIVSFLKSNRESLVQKGYDLTSWIAPHPPATTR